MNVSQQNIDKVSAVIKIEVTKADYQEKVDKALRAYRQKANIPGFRKGMVPMGLIQKMVGKSVLAEEFNKLVSESLFNYIRENKLNVLGEPLPVVDQPEINFDTQEDFTVSFDVALAPEISVNLSKKDKIDYYNIAVDDAMIEKQCEALANRFGTQEPSEVAGEKDMIRGKFVELDESGNVKDGGVVVESGIISPNYFKNEDEKGKFIGVKVGQKVVFNPAKSCDNNETELASMLHIKKEEAENMKSDFEVEISSILGFKPAEMGQELFDNVFGKDVVKTEEEYKAKVREMIENQMKPESDYKFGIDARKALEDKVGDIQLPDALLKRWLVATGEKRTAESVEEEYPKMVPDLKWQLIKEQIVKETNIKVDDADIKDMARKITRTQFAQYGMMSVPEDLLDKYATDMLKDKKMINGIIERATEEKILATIKNAVTLNEKTISADEFYKMFETK